MQNVTLKFHPNIQKYTNGVREHTISVDDLLDIRNCLEHLFPRLSKHIRRIISGVNRSENMALVNKHKRMLHQEDYILNRLQKDDTEFYVVPLLIGGGGGTDQQKGGRAQVVLGAILVVVGVFFKSPQLIIAGMSMMVSGLIAMSMRPPKKTTSEKSTDEEARDNNMFGGLSNTITSNTPVPIVYGRTRIAGQFISGDIRTFEHGRNESVLVNSLFPAGAS